MDTQFQSQYIPFSQTGKFSKIVLDYISQAPELREFYTHPVNIEGIKAAIAQRQQFSTNRELLASQFELQYSNHKDSEEVHANIRLLREKNTFTVCTAHQPNLFTGHLYFVYKIMHTIKLAAFLKEQLPDYHFVPVFFMGSEDADLEELNHVVIDGEKYEWGTRQTGAVGRMKVDDNLIGLIHKISGRLKVEKYGGGIAHLLKECYRKGATIEEATFLLVHHLFKEYGLLVLLPDNAAFKREIIAVMEDDLFNHASSEIVNRSSNRLALNYKAQAYPREINLFYLIDGVRNRIIEVGGHFVVHDTEIIFTAEQIRKELQEHPERFSPNVILRGLFQEVILPDVAWIGGGGELAYWLQLKSLFENFSVPFPVLIVRNSFQLIEEKYLSLLHKLRFIPADLFRGKEILLNELVRKDSNSRLSLEEEKLQIKNAYSLVLRKAEATDSTLAKHVAALEARQRKTLDALAKKMLRAEKRQFSDESRQLDQLFSALFPGGNLQERIDNFMIYYSKWGSHLFDMLYDASSALEQEFCIVEEVHPDAG